MSKSFLLIFSFNILFTKLMWFVALWYSITIYSWSLLLKCILYSFFLHLSFWIIALFIWELSHFLLLLFCLFLLLLHLFFVSSVSSITSLVLVQNDCFLFWGILRFHSSLLFISLLFFSNLFSLYASAHALLRSFARHFPEFTTQQRSYRPSHRSNPPRIPLDFLFKLPEITVMPRQKSS